LINISLNAILSWEGVGRENALPPKTVNILVHFDWNPCDRFYWKIWNVNFLCRIFADISTFWKKSHFWDKYSNLKRVWA